MKKIKLIMVRKCTSNGWLADIYYNDNTFSAFVPLPYTQRANAKYVITALRAKRETVNELYTIALEQ